MKKTKSSKATDAALTQFLGLTITVKGLALFYKKVINQTTGEFIVKMRIPQARDQRPIKSNEHDSKIKIVTQAQTGTATTSRTRAFSIPIGGSIGITHTNALPGPDFINLPGVIKVNDFHPNARFKSSTVLDTISSLITIKDASFRGDDIPEEFERWQINNSASSSIPEDRKHRGKRELVQIHPRIFPALRGEVFFDQNPSTSKATQIRVTGIAQTPFDIVLEYSNDPNTLITHTIDITNLCESGNNSCEIKSDFLEYYEILAQGTLGGNEFDFILPVSKGARAPCNVSYFGDNHDPE